MKRKLYDDKDSGWMYLFILTVPIILGFIIAFTLQAVAYRYNFENLTENSIILTVYSLIISLSYFIIFFAYNKTQKIEIKKASLIKVKFGWKNLFLCVIIAFVTLFGFNTLINYLFHLLEKIGYQPDTSLPLPLTNGWWLTINIVILAVLPAVFEELIYRGVILNGLRRFGSIKAVVISALLFALAHGSAMQFFYQFILGLVLGFVLIKTGSIVAAMIIHFLNNATVIVFNYIYPSETEKIFTTNTIILAFVIAISSIAVLILLISRLKEKKHAQISYNDEYNRVYSLEKKQFSDYKSKIIFSVACVLAGIYWIFGTFF